MDTTRLQDGDPVTFMDDLSVSRGKHPRKVEIGREEYEWLKVHPMVIEREVEIIDSVKVAPVGWLISMDHRNLLRLMFGAEEVVIVGV